MKKDRNNPIADFVRQRRKSLKMTQVDLSERAGVGLRFVRELEQGKQTLKVDKVNEVLMLFGKQLGPVTLKMDFDDEQF